MSRTHRASIAASFAYLQFALSIVVGLGLVPFVLHRVGERLYGYWLASGEVLAYAAMADLGVLGVVPWLIAEADGRQDRPAMQRIMSTAACAALFVSAAYGTLVLILWHVAPAVLSLAPADRAAIVGPLSTIACVTAVVLPLRVAGSTLIGLQDVKFYGAMSTGTWALDLVITVTLLMRGYGLYALALGAAVPSLISAAVMIVRLRIVAPDLVRGWPRPSTAAVARLFREGFGAWLGAWGWRLSIATDAIVLASLGHPLWIITLAMTAKLGQMMTQMSWVPGDSSLVGLAQLSGEQKPERLRDAVSAVFRVYLALATGGTCVLLAVNGGFVSGWVGTHLFAGAGVNAVLAAIILVSTFAHGMAVVASTLGKRMHVGLAALASGTVQVVLALMLGRRLGLIGIPLASLCAHMLVLVPLLLPALADCTGLAFSGLTREVFRPWAVVSMPVILACGVIGVLRLPLGLPGTVVTGVLVGLMYALCARSLILGYPPVAALIRGRLAAFRLEGLLALAGLEGTGRP
jgi:O-antigen/teichoic acid export membrane protein